MKHIEIDEALHQYLISTTEYIGESASSILRRLLSLPAVEHHKGADVVSETETLTASHEVLAPAQRLAKTTVESSSGLANPVDYNPLDSVFNYINKEELATQRGVVGRFLLILSALHRVHPDNFFKVQAIRGRDRLYFATSEKHLAQSGSSTKPRQIPDSEFWVMTNSNSTRKKMMLTEVTRTLGYSDRDIEVIRDLL